MHTYESMQYSPLAVSLWAHPAIQQATYMTEHQALAAYRDSVSIRDWAARAALEHNETSASNTAKQTESKPRLAKHEAQLLEAEFQRNPKPNSVVKKAFAEQMKVDIARINVSLSTSNRIFSTQTHAT